ncbi:hypothetical protein SMD44_08522 [Streptomyces alboflavus]|uniref:Uncharacterized protein n=1 Tax=Streptomyces alboflavus TaxID=67267 RepID=A0A1Z1WRI9_9ACTN|nr:hypothetical protein SMD44_08522 [Streptomyces alboflavus]
MTALTVAVKKFGALRLSRPISLMISVSGNIPNSFASDSFAKKSFGLNRPWARLAHLSMPGPRPPRGRAEGWGSRRRAR